jgi:catechol 2,3-dioxygenase-like lactoylglutathione lyase family enzyme
MSQQCVFREVWTTDLQASRRFYAELFGRAIFDTPAGPMLGEGGVVPVEPGGATLALRQGAAQR